jgi:hypothetical protein
VTRPYYEDPGNKPAVQRTVQHAPAVHPARSPVLPALSAMFILLGLPCLLGGLPRWPLAFGIAVVLLTCGVIVFAMYIASYVMMKHTAWVYELRKIENLGITHHPEP